MINKYWDLANVNVTSEVAVEPGDLICYGTPTPKPGDPQIC